MTKTEIKQARVTAGDTQKSAAERIGAKLRTWQDWEYGKRNMPAAKFKLYLIETGQHEAFIHTP